MVVDIYEVYPVVSGHSVIHVQRTLCHSFVLFSTLYLYKKIHLHKRRISRM